MSGTVVSAVCGIVRAGCEVVDVIKNTYNICTQPADLLALRVARIFTRLAGLTAYGCEMGALNSGASNGTLFAIKASEVAVRLIDVPVQVGLVTGEAMQQETSAMQFIEKAILQPAITLSRAKNEMLMYQERNFLNMSPKQQATQTRLVEVATSPFTTRLQAVPITVEESQKTLARCENDAPALNVAEAIVKTGLMSKATELSSNVFEFGADVYNRLSSYDALISRLQTANTALATADAVSDDAFNLLALNSIPTELHNDRVFKEFICPITYCPIRHPVGDPNGITVYERSAIEEVIRRQGRSPWTHAPLQREQLLEKPELVARINARLQFHMQRIQLIVAAGLNA